jgi:hypothetical protein
MQTVESLIRRFLESPNNIKISPLRREREGIYRDPESQERVIRDTDKALYFVAQLNLSTFSTSVPHHEMCGKSFKKNQKRT